MPDLLFQSKQERLPDGSLIIITKVLGAIDGTTVRKFEEKLVGFFNQGVRNLILDFSDVKYINSTGMGLLVKLADKFQENGGDIKLVGIPEKVIALFDMLGLLSLFKVYETQQDAIQSIMQEGIVSRTPTASAPPPPPSAPPPPPAPSVKPPSKPQPSSFDMGMGGAVIGDISEPSRPEIQVPGSRSKKTVQSKPEVERKLKRKKVAKKTVQSKAEAERKLKRKKIAKKRDAEPKIAKQVISEPAVEQPPQSIPEPDSLASAALLQELQEEPSIRSDDTRLSGKLLEPMEAPPLEISEEKVASGMGKIDFEDKQAQEIISRETKQSFAIQEKEKLQKKKEEQYQLPHFEKWLSDEAGVPGAIERVFAQSRRTLKIIQKTIGLSFIVIVNFIDNIVNLVTGYINGIYQAWKTYKTIERRMARRDPSSHIDALLADLELSRHSLSRLFYFPCFQPKTEFYKDTFALELILEMRAHLDQMKRDLSVINAQETRKTVTKTVVDFFKSFLPNPFEIFPIIKDFFILAFIMKYSRAEIEKMYTDLMISYENIINLMAQNLNDKKNVIWSDHEIILKNTSGKSYSAEDKNNINVCISECRHKIQRLIQMLCNPKYYIDPKYWTTHDLLLQVQREQQNFSGQTLFSLELEKRIRKQIKKEMLKKGITFTKEEILKHQNEEIKLNQDYKLQKKLHNQFI